MTTFIQKLKGKKTYIIAALVGVLSMVHALGWIDTQAYITLLGLLGGAGAATMRSGINNSK